MNCGKPAVLGQANSAEAAELFPIGSVCLALEEKRAYKSISW